MSESDILEDEEESERIYCEDCGEEITIFPEYILDISLCISCWKERQNNINFIK
jgi:hypothetical protein